MMRSLVETRMWMRSQKPTITTPMWKVSLLASSAFISSSNSSAGEAGERAMLARHLQARVAGKRLGQACEQAFGKGVAVGLQLVDVAFGERGDVAGAGRLLLRSRGRRQRLGHQHQYCRERCADCAHLPIAR